jgi:hypothetical protein
MPDTDIVRRSVVLHQLPWYGRDVVNFGYERQGPRDWEPGLSVALSRQAWEDMGQPGRITVVVEPGDTLNR